MRLAQFTFTAGPIHQWERDHIHRVNVVIVKFIYPVNCYFPAVREQNRLHCRVMPFKLTENQIRYVLIPAVSVFHKRDRTRGFYCY
jgi:hypothetical protein